MRGRVRPLAEAVRWIVVLVAFAISCGDSGGDRNAVDKCAPSPTFEVCQRATNEADCARSGGSWERAGLRGEVCVCPTGQGECPCTDGDPCLERCVSPSSIGQACALVTSGFCAESSPFIGCFCTLDRLGGGVLCVD